MRYVKVIASYVLGCEKNVSGLVETTIKETPHDSIYFETTMKCLSICKHLKKQRTEILKTKVGSMLLQKMYNVRAHSYKNVPFNQSKVIR